MYTVHTCDICDMCVMCFYVTNISSQSLKGPTGIHACSLGMDLTVEAAAMGAESSGALPTGISFSGLFLS